MSTLVVERHGDALLLVSYAHPRAVSCKVIAQFASEEAAKIYRVETARSMLFAREVGRNGLG